MEKEGREKYFNRRQQLRKAIAELDDGRGQNRGK
jgi:hypothetical protein